MLTYSRPYKTTFMDSKRKHLPYLPNDVLHLIMHQRNRLMYIDGRWRSQPDPYAISHAMYIQELEEEITNKEKEMKDLKEEILEDYATMEEYIEMVEENERCIDELEAEIDCNCRKITRLQRSNQFWREASRARV